MGSVNLFLQGGEGSYLLTSLKQVSSSPQTLQHTCPCFTAPITVSSASEPTVLHTLAHTTGCKACLTHQKKGEFQGTWGVRNLVFWRLVDSLLSLMAWWKYTRKSQWSVLSQASDPRRHEAHLGKGSALRVTQSQSVPDLAEVCWLDAQSQASDGKSNSWFHDHPCNMQPTCWATAQAVLRCSEPMGLLENSSWWHLPNKCVSFHVNF